jgi:hypothetical protein
MNASSLESTFSLDFDGTVERSCKKNAYVCAANDNDLVIYVNTFNPDSKHSVSMELADYFGVEGADRSVIHTIMTLPEALVEDELRRLGVVGMDGVADLPDEYLWREAEPPVEPALTTSGISGNSTASQVGEVFSGCDDSDTENPAWTNRLQQCSANVQRAAAQPCISLRACVVPTMNDTGSASNNPIRPTKSVHTKSAPAILSHISTTPGSVSATKRARTSGFVDDFTPMQASRNSKETDRIGYLGELYASILCLALSVVTNPLIIFTTS